MDEQTALAWLEGNVSREKREKLGCFVSLLLEANESQNLIAKATSAEVYARHIVDSAQLALLGTFSGQWLDLGSGAGLPGIVTAIITGAPTILVEERRLRIEFLDHVVQRLELGNVRVEGRAIERLVALHADIITARAFAPLDRLFELAMRHAHADTLWVLPKGRRAKEELASLEGKWHADIIMEPSITDPDSLIVVARGVRRVGGARR